VSFLHDSSAFDALVDLLYTCIHVTTYFLTVINNDMFLYAFVPQTNCCIGIIRFRNESKPS